MITKKILVAVSGSIAAYKSASLIRLLVKSGHEVKVIMTPSATAFISPLTLSVLSKHPVHTDVIDQEAWNNHVDLGLWADLMIIAPATANTIAKLANGICDHIVAACYLSAKCQIMIAPAMDRDMWKHPSTQSNIQKLISYGNQIIDVGEGELASGLEGKGRMAEPEDIQSLVSQFFSRHSDLDGKKVLITAGPTVEAIDPVRFISNRSTGKMGISIAKNCVQRGAQVILVLGPTTQSVHHPDIEVINVSSAHEMFEACEQHYSSCDIGIMSAAVADYTPLNYADKKIKKKEGDLLIELKRTKDIAGHLGKVKKPNQLLVGFALETNNELVNAQAKLKKKNFDVIVLNSLNDKGAGFGHNTNKVTLISSDGKQKALPLLSKDSVAEHIIDFLQLKSTK